MKKRIFSLFLAFIMAFGVCASAGAVEDAHTLRFDENGEFVIMNIADCQDGYPADERMIKFIDATLKVYQPDIVVLGGDNSVGEKETKDKAIEELTSVFVENETYFTLVFGNHDREQGVENDELLAMYQKHGGKYCLAYDEVPSLHGTGTHSLPVMSSDGEDVKFNLWMFDSGSHYIDENGNDLGFYDCVREDQIEWYKNKSADLEAAAGEKIPSLAFQHIVVADVYDSLFRESSVDLGVLTPVYDGTRYSFLPKLENLEEGFLFEFPCPSEINHGQFDAMVERGDVLAIFSGHDHINNYVTELDGIKIINTAGATYNSYGNEFTRGMRVITINEEDTWNFETESVTVNQFALDNEEFAKDAGISKALAVLSIGFGEFLLALTKVASVFSSLISLVA